MILLTMMIPHRWVDPEFKKEEKEDTSREVEAGTEEEVQPLNAKK